MSEDIFSLLSINSDSLRDYPLQANLVNDHQTEKVINGNIRRLKQIEIAIFSDKQIQASPQSIEEIISKVKEASSLDNQDVEWSTHELRIVSYYLMKLQSDSKAFTYALHLLEKHWRNLFFNGLVFYVMNTWNNISKNEREEVCELITGQLSKYQDKNRRYLLLKNHTNFFDENGPLRMAILMVHKDDDIYNAPMLIGYKSSTFSQSYYSDVIINYFKEKQTDNLSVVEDVLNKHTLSRTKKIVYANLVDQADKSGTEMRQNDISRSAARILGDISLSSTWAPFNDATPEEEVKLRHAKDCINKWYARKVIQVFFDICIQDPNRKDFWLKYIDFIIDFRIAGSSAIRQSLCSDYRTGHSFQNHFIETRSQKTKTAALILYIDNKVFVEFSDSGSLYIYNKSNTTVRTLSSKKHINSINDLKNTFLSAAVEKTDYKDYYYQEEGSMRHIGYWQSRLTNWFKEIMHIYTVQEQSEQNSTYNSVMRSGYTTEYKMSSKWIFNDTCRIVANPNGYHLNIKRNNAYVQIKRLDWGESLVGSIWVKKPDSGYFLIVHAYDESKEKVVGYIKEENGYAIFKENLNTSESKTIKI